MNQQHAQCPYCGVTVWDSQPQCPSCHKVIDRCNVCRYPIYSGKDNCGRCGNFVAKEPKLQAKAAVIGDPIAGREVIFKVSVNNIGNRATSIDFSVSLPEELGGTEIKGEEIEMETGQKIEREYHFTPLKPGKFTVPTFDIYYTKSDNTEAAFQIPPINIAVDGMPKIVSSVEAGAPEVKLGEEVLLYVKIENKGTTFAKNIRLQVFTPPTVFHKETKTLLPTLGVDEKRTAVIKLVPIFDGEHPVEVRLHFQTPPTQKSGSANQEITAGSLTLKVNRL